ncbi:MAG: TonB-dependent receptor plug domain-containing protein, partial [Melioribacteraceae bacterium]
AELSLANIQRIEIVRGSHSTLYGSSAIGGVINFITEKNMKPGLNADLNLQTGTFGEGSFDFTQNLLLNYTTHEGFYFSGEVYNSNVKGFDATVKNTPPVFGSYDKDNFDKTDIFGKAGYAANNLDLFIAYKRTDQKEDIDDGAFADDDN